MTNEEIQSLQETASRYRDRYAAWSAACGRFDVVNIRDLGREVHELSLTLIYYTNADTVEDALSAVDSMKPAVGA